MSKNWVSNRKILQFSEANKYLASRIESSLQQQIVQNDHATLVLTGGKSIVNFLQDLQKIQVPWHKITLMLSDDRLVSENDIESNENLINKNFINNPKIKEKIDYISIKKIYFDSKNGNYNDIIKKLKNAVIILSMGLDGHVASLFTKDDLLGEEELKFVVRPDFKRLSLSYKAMLGAAKIYILVYGSKKIDFFRKLDINNFYLRDLFLFSEIILVDQKKEI